MYIEVLDGRYAGQTRDIETSAAQDLIKAGRAKLRYGDPTPASPVGAGAYRDTTLRSAEAIAPAEGSSPALVARLDEPTDKPLVAGDTTDHKPVTITVPADNRKKKNR